MSPFNKLAVKHINQLKNKLTMSKEPYKYFPQTKDELRSLIEQRIKGEGNAVDLNDIDVSQITDMSYLFLNLDFNGDITSWNVSNVTTMSFMFCNCNSFNQDISGWNVSNIRHRTNPFGDCPIKEEYKPKFKQIN